jgi:HPt (histidine-containing phosphotransfer) domain-containing protein
MSNDDPILDAAQVEGLRQLFSDGFSEFVNTFLTDFEEKEKILATAIQNKDLDTIIKTAHFLKGSSLNMGATKLGHCCRDIEMAGKDNNFTEITANHNLLQKAYLETKQAFLDL